MPKTGSRTRPGGASPQTPARSRKTPRKTPGVSPDNSDGDGRGTINLVKLCVGADTVEDLEGSQAGRRASNPRDPLMHVTRMWPKREDELLNGGSLYWVFRGQVLARQRVLDLVEVQGDDGIRRCGIVLDPEIVRTRPAPRRPFQGWRYLRPEDSPADSPAGRGKREELPPEVDSALAELGVI